MINDDIKCRSITKLSIFFCVFSVFTKEIGSSIVFGIEFDFIGYTFFILYFIERILTKRLMLTRDYLFVVLCLLVIHFFQVLLWQANYLGVLKQLVPILIIYTALFDIMQRCFVEGIFKLYVKLAYYSAVFGLIQFAFKFANINLLSHGYMRLDSVAYEPSHYASILIPSLLYTTVYFKSYKKEFFVQLLALFLTFSLTSYVVYGTVILIALNQVQYLFLLIPLSFFVYINFIYSNTEFSYRIDGVMNFLKTGDMTGIHGTPLSFATNMRVAIESIKHNVFFGSGLGGHESKYFEVIEKTDISYGYLYGLNAKSAHSLSIRVISELGLVGFVWYVYIMIRNFFLVLSVEERTITVACVSHFLCKTMKLGGYFDYGTPFFFLMLVQVFVKNKRR